MVAPNPEVAGDVAGAAREIPIRSRSHFQRLTRSMTRAAKLQWRIMTLKARMLMKKLILSAALGAGATMAGIAGLIFAYIFIFKLLTDIVGMKAVWAWLIFAGFHLLIAGVMAMVAANLWREPKAKQEGKP